VRLVPGGSAANFAARAARGGATVTFFGRVGDDVAGRLLSAELTRSGVDARVKAITGEATGNILVLVGGDGGPGASRMVSDPGASALLAPEDLDARAFAEADLVHVTGYSWLRSGPAAAARAAVDLARRGTALVSFDPGPAHLIEAYGAARLRADLEAHRFDVVFPNHEEGTAMTGATEPDAIVRALAELAQVVVLKLGGEGCVVAAGGRVERVPAERTDVVDTTGAGDAFAAAFAVAYASVRDPVAAARAGARAAAEVVARVGAR
jgi:sugar/nucleoside kinase (ribokinase family)